MLEPGYFGSGDDPRGGVPLRYVCFKAKCDQKPEVPVAFDTQFGPVPGMAKQTKFICAPEGSVGPGSTTTTTLPACTGAQVGGSCWYLGAPGESCTQVCADAGKAYSTATESYAGSGGTLANCDAVLDALGVLPVGSTDAGCGIAMECMVLTTVPVRIRCLDTPADPSASGPDFVRACACQ